jgi:hypothetical protein
VSQISGWILGCATEVFRDFDGLKRHLTMKFAADALTLVE